MTNITHVTTCQQYKTFFMGLTNIAIVQSAIAILFFDRYSSTTFRDHKGSDNQLYTRFL